jgi:hypothetical protein
MVVEDARVFIANIAEAIRIMTTEAGRRCFAAPDLLDSRAQKEAGRTNRLSSLEIQRTVG